MNKAIVLGRLTSDPTLRYTPNGTTVATFSLAVDRRATNQQGERETDFLNIVVWSKLAELCNQYLSKGRQAAVEGRIQTRSYENNEGRRIYVTEIVAENVTFIGGGNGGQGQHSSGGQGGSRSGGSFNDNPFADDQRPISFDDSDLPF